MSISEKIKQALTKVIGQVDNDELKSTLRQCVSDVSELNEVLLQTQNEAGNHRKGKSEIETQLREAKEQIEKLTQQTPDIEALKAKAGKYDTLLAEQTKAKTESWAKKAEIFAIAETDKRHPLITKIKDQFHFAAEGSALTEQQIDENMRLMSTLEAAGSLEISDNDTPGLPRPINNQKLELTQTSKEQAALNISKGKL